MEKTPGFFLVFCISIHSSPFPFFLSYSLLFRLIALFPFRDPKTIAKRNTFKCNRLRKKPSLSNSLFWVPSCDSPNSKWTVFRWTVVYTISLHSSTEQNKGLLFSLLDLTNLSPIYRKFFCQKIWNTKMAYGKNTCIFPCFFLHFYPFLFIPVCCFLFLVISLDCSVSFPGSKNYSQKEHF